MPPQAGGKRRTPPTGGRFHGHLRLLAGTLAGLGLLYGTTPAWGGTEPLPPAAPPGHAATLGDGSPSASDTAPTHTAPRSLSPDTSAPKSSPSSAAEAAPPPATEKERPDPHSTEIAIIPILSINSDEGYGLGVALSFARFQPDADPYVWRIRGILYLTLREGVDGKLEVPVQNHGVDLDLPHVGGTPYRLGLRVGYRRKIVDYHGLGGRKLTTIPAGPNTTRRYFQYNRSEAYIETKHRLPLGSHLFGLLKLSGHYWWPEVLPGSKLADDLAGQADVDAQYVAGALHGTREHLQLKAGLALQWDTRDEEVNPTSGMFHDVSACLAGGATGERFTYFGANATARFYVSLLGPKLVLALRARADLRWGDTPIYDLLVLGQELLLRGVPNGLLNGRASALGTVELRSLFLPFDIFGQHLTLGAVAFADTGYLWADAIHPRPALDPAIGHGLSVAVGGGLRLRWGRAFVLRFDVAWSPDGVGYYVNVDQTF